MAADPLSPLTLNAVQASRKAYAIAGIAVDIYGEEQLHADVVDVVCLWLLGPRLSTKESMRPIADACIAHWDAVQLKSKVGLIVAILDHRNHGSRQIHPLSNTVWRDGNAQHAQDMFSIYQGSAADVSQLINYLPMYVFPKDNHKLVDHMALGVSLGGHSVWHLLLHEPRITTGIVIIGCPDYLQLMKHRAHLSRLASWTQSSPPGSAFIGSEDFPDSLIQMVGRYDPAGYFFGVNSQTPDRIPEEDDIARSRYTELLDKTFRGKRILNLAGGADKLVPHSLSAAYVNWLRDAAAPGGCYSDGGIVFESIIYDEVGHEVTDEMLDKASLFLSKGYEVRASKHRGDVDVERRSEYNP